MTNKPDAWIDPDVFRRGIWDAINAAEQEPRSISLTEACDIAQHGRAEQGGKSCPRCKGTGTNESRLYLAGKATCLLCNGTGQSVAEQGGKP